MSTRQFRRDPSPDRARRVAAALDSKGLSEPSADDVALLLDLRKRVEGYLKPACEAWMAALRMDEPHLWDGAFGTVEGWDADLVHYTYLPHSADYDDQRASVYIPLADLLPQFSTVHTTVAALVDGSPARDS